MWYEWEEKSNVCQEDWTTETKVIDALRMMTVDVSVSTKSGIRQVHANTMRLLKHKLSSLF